MSLDQRVNESLDQRVNGSLDQGSGIIGSLDQGSGIIGSLDQGSGIIGSIDSTTVVIKSKPNRLNAAQRFQVMERMKQHQNDIVKMAGLKDVADFILRETNVVISPQTAANYLDALGIMKPGGGLDAVTNGRIIALEEEVTRLRESLIKLTEQFDNYVLREVK